MEAAAHEHLQRWGEARCVRCDRDRAADLPPRRDGVCSAYVPMSDGGREPDPGA